MDPGRRHSWLRDRLFGLHNCHRGPRIGRELPAHLFGVLEGQSYVYTGYLLTQSALLILAGALNDFYGRRRMFAIGVAGFGVMSALCGVAPTMEMLVLFRVLQGAAGARAGEPG